MWSVTWITTRQTRPATTLFIPQMKKIFLNRRLQTFTQPRNKKQCTKNKRPFDVSPKCTCSHAIVGFILHLSAVEEWGIVSNILEFLEKAFLQIFRNNVLTVYINASFK